MALFTKTTFDIMLLLKPLDDPNVLFMLQPKPSNAEAVLK